MVGLQALGFMLGSRGQFPNSEHSMAVDIRMVPCLADNYAVILRDPSTGATAVVDAPEADPILHALNQADWRLTHILVTHKHGDHVQGITALKQRYGATDIAHRPEAKEITVTDL